MTTIKSIYSLHQYALEKSKTIALKLIQGLFDGEDAEYYQDLIENQPCVELSEGKVVFVSDFGVFEIPEEISSGEMSVEEYLDSQEKLKAAGRRAELRQEIYNNEKLITRLHEKNRKLRQAFEVVDR